MPVIERFNPVSEPGGAQMNFRVSAPMLKGLKELATRAGMKVTPYASLLLSAAYTARCKPPTGDADLDAAVGMVAVLWAEGRDHDAIAATLGLSEATVKRIVKGWQQHHLARADRAAA